MQCWFVILSHKDFDESDTDNQGVDMKSNQMVCHVRNDGTFSKKTIAKNIWI